MKGTDHFKELIKNYLDNRAKEDELFRAKYETTTRSNSMPPYEKTTGLS